jgi:ABC-type uncharacterized transport system ATPase subunit
MDTYIKHLDVLDFGCIKRLSMPLTPLHALIGPNDAGKTTILRALRTVTLGANFPLVGEASTGADEIPPMPGEGRPVIRATYPKYRPYEMWLRSDERSRIGGLVPEGSPVVPQLTPRTERGAARLSYWYVDRSDGGPHVETQWHAWMHPAPIYSLDHSDIYGDMDFRRLTLGRRPRLLRLDPDAMRASTSLIPEGQSPGFLDSRGLGLASVYDVIINRSPRVFARLADEIEAKFPNVKDINLFNVNQSTKELAVQLKSGVRVRAADMSEGLLYYLAFLAVRELEPASILLVEEPENGLHPARIRDVVDVLREISKTTQVVMATHSPLVVNELEGDEVTIVWRDEEAGTQTKPLSKVARYPERSEIYSNGELWLSYADGVAEERLREDARDDEDTP